MKRLLALAAVLEAVTGLALIIVPALVASLLLGASVSEAGAAVGRVAGLGLFSLGTACWPGRDVARRPAAALRAMLTYNVLVTGYLIFLGIGGQLVGVLLWPAVAVHSLLSLLLGREWLRMEQTRDTQG